MKIEVENWIRQSQKDLESAEKNFSIQEYALTSFLCQQSVEKALKAFYLAKNNNLLKTHNITRLAKELQLPDKIIEKITLLEPVYQETRYPDMSKTIPAEQYEEGDAKEFLEIAREVLTWLEEKMN